MPNYAYYCKVCKREWENFHYIAGRNKEKCECGHKGTIDMSKYTKAIHIFQPFISQEMDVMDIPITSKRQYKNELKKRGLSCRAF